MDIYLPLHRALLLLFVHNTISSPFSLEQYELEHEKLAMELEEERKSHKERDQCIREQRMNLDNFNCLVSLSDSDRKSSQV